MLISKLVTIVIPYKNEENYIGNLLQDIAFQKGIEGTRIILADGNSTDNSLQIIKDSQTIYPFLNIEVIQGGNVSEGRNNGAKLVVTPYICFIDADVKLYSNDILYSSCKSMDLGYDLLTCKLKCYKGNILSRVGFRLFNLVNKILSKKYPFAVGTYFFVKTKKFKQLGMFNENTDTSEDFLFSQKFAPSQFIILDRYVGQDDRRIKKMGYLGMIKYLVYNFYKFLKKDYIYFSKKTNYWS